MVNEKSRFDVFDDEIAKLYGEITRAGYHPQQKYIAELLQIIPKGSSVLELGCGTGDILIPLQENGRECYGVDKSSAMLYQLSLRNKNIQTFLKDIRLLNLVGDYDYVFSCNGVFSIKGNELESYILDENDLRACLEKYSDISKNGILINKGTEKEPLRLKLNDQEYVHREIREKDIIVMTHLLFEDNQFKGIKTHVKKRYPLKKILNEAKSVKEHGNFKQIIY